MSQSKVLVVDMDEGISRNLCTYLLKKGHPVVAIGTSERVLGTLKACENFQFHKFDLVNQEIVRSYLYGIDYILFLDTSLKMLEKLDQVYQSIRHLKGKIPRLILLSRNLVYPFDGLKKNLEDQEPPEPEGASAEKYRGAEVMVHNYSSHLDAAASILRLPMLVDQNSVDPAFSELMSLVRRGRSVNFDPENDFLVQWVIFEDLFQQISTLLQTKWTGLETFHLYTYSMPFSQLFEALKKQFKSGSEIRSDSKLGQTFKGLLSVSPLVKEKFEELQNLTTVDFLKQGSLDCELSRRILTYEAPELRSFLKGIGKK